MEPAKLSAGRHRVLIVEDEMFIALALQELVEDAGYDVIGPVNSIQLALAAIEREPPTIGLLDANLAGKTSTPIAAALKRGGIPFGVLTGYTNLNHEDDVLRDAPRLMKPFRPTELVTLLEQLCP
jgi:DNA-binding response OmpR family regulator